jgi:alpha-galactosidase
LKGLADYVHGRGLKLGIDDEAPAAAPATFTIHADDTAVATSGPLSSGAAPVSLTADLAGARWLRLTTAGAAGTHTDWADPVLTCGDAGPGDPVLPVRRTIYLTGRSGLEVDLRTEDVGTVGEFAVQVGEDLTWCQGGRWAWTNPHSSRTVTEPFDDIECPSGTTLDVSQIRLVWVFLNTGGVVHLDHV